MPPRFCLLFLALAMVGCRQLPPAEADGVFQRACGAYLDGRYTEAARLFGEIRERSRGRQSQEAAYWQGRSFLAQGRLPEARAAFGAALVGESELRRRALAGLASAWAGDPDSAEAQRQIQALRDKYGAEVPAEVGRAAAAPSSPASSAASAAVAGAKDVRFIVQVGNIYRDLAVAEALCSRVKRAGFDCFVKRIVDAGQRAYLVQAGAFSSAEVAEAQARRLRSRGFPVMVR